MHLPRLFVVGGLLGGSLLTTRVSAPRVEVHRIQSHLDSVLTELGARNLGALSSEQRAHRAVLVHELRAYRDRGVFPHNYDFPGRRVPYFVDRETRTLCAVADLLAFTGRRDVVDRVARGNNNVLVAKLAGDSAFRNWLDASGLTLEEAARIQVVYSFSPSPSEVALLMGTPMLAGTAGVMALVNSSGNADGHGKARTIAGLVSGAASIAAGATVAGSYGLGSSGAKFGAVSAAIGGLSILSSVRAMHSHARIMAAERDAKPMRDTAEPTVSPLVTTANGRTSAGAMVSLRF